MVELNHRERTIKVKIVYYGPPVGGKTTNLQVLHSAAEPQHRGELISINSAQDRTILFDLLPLRTPGFRGFDLRLQLLAVPGQPVYAATRRLVLKGADSLVFVANSARDRFEENLQSYREMTQNLLSHHLDPSHMPVVFQYNKRDLPDVVDIAALQRSLNARRSHAVPAVAVRGEGVLETFTAILARTVIDIAKRYAILDVKEGAPVRQWAQETVLHLFGTQSIRVAEPAAPLPSTGPMPALAGPRAGPKAGSKAEPKAESKAEPKAAVRPASAQSTALTPVAVAEVSAPRGHIVLRTSPVARDEPARAAAFPEGRAIELVESYAEASTQLGAAVGQLREERDAAHQHLEDLRRAMQAAQEILAGTPFDAALGPVLFRMARIAGSEHASFWVAQGREPPRAAALLGLAADPVLASPVASGQVTKLAQRCSGPSFALAAESHELARAMQTGERRFTAVLAVPFRTPGGLQGVAVFYYGADEARPGAAVLEHLGEIPRALSAALELAATLQTVRAAERALELALAGSASLRGLTGLVRSLEELRDRLGEIRNRTDAPPWFREQYVRLAPALASALEDGRSLLGFSRGEVKRESVYLEDLLAELRTAEVSVELDPAVETIPADATLLRVALRAVADELRLRAGSNTVPLSIRAALSARTVRIAVDAEAGQRATASLVNSGLGLGLAQRIAELHGGRLEDAPAKAVGPVVLALPL